MIPSRFGKSPGQEFTQSPGRERDHPLGHDLSSFPAIIVEVGLLGFMGFKPNDPGPLGHGSGIFAYVDNLHEGHKLYRTARLAESSNYPFSGGATGSRTLEWEYKKMTAQTGFPVGAATVTQTFVEGNAWTPQEVQNASGPSITQFAQGNTTRELGNISPPDLWKISSTTTVSKEINILSWLALLRAKLDTVPDFPGRYVLQLKSDVALPVGEENPPPDSPDYELVRIATSPTSTFSSMTFARNYGYLPLPTELAGTGVVGSGSTATGTQLLFGVVSGVVKITLVKVLMRTIRADGTGYLDFADWTIGQSNFGALPVQPDGRLTPYPYEISCFRSGISEVLNPPSVDGSLIGFDLQETNTFRRFAFPLSPIPTVSQGMGLVPSCSPGYT